MKDLHVALEEEVLASLNALSRRLKVSRNLLVREALLEYVAKKERERIAAEMSRYAHEMAPHSAEFVAEFAAEVDRNLWEHTDW